MRTVFTIFSSKSSLQVALFFLIFEVGVRLHHFGFESVYAPWKYTDLDLVYSGIGKKHKDPALGWTMKEKTLVYHKGVSFETNSIGARDKEYGREQWSNSKRVVVLGKSLTAGVGVPQEKGWTELFEKTISKDQTYSVLNYATPGYSYVQVSKLYFEKVIGLQPQVLILPVFLADFYSPVIKERKDPPVTLWHRINSFDNILNHFFSPKLYKYFFRKIYSIIGNEDWRNRSYPYLFKKKDLTTGVKEYMKMIRDARRRGIELFFVGMPVRMTDFYKSVSSKNALKFADLAKNNEGIHFMDISNLYEIKNVKDVDIYFGEPHPNEKAHSLIADVVSQYFGQIYRP